MTYYDVLEVASTAGFAEIRSSYRRLVKIYHPDLNPSAEARERIVKLTEAYEVLSDPMKKLVYDNRLNGVYTPPQETVQQEDPREVMKREYIRRKREKEQQHWEQLFAMKVKFYQFQRYFAWFALALGLLFTADYYFLRTGDTYTLTDIRITRFGDCGISLGNFGYKTDVSFYEKAKKHQVKEVTLMYSRLHGMVVGFTAKDVGFYHVQDTMHTLKNVFPFLLLVISALLIWKREYADWSLTLGLLAFFIALFVIMLSYVTMKHMFY